MHKKHQHSNKHKNASANPPNAFRHQQPPIPPQSSSRYLITPQPVWHDIDVSSQPGFSTYSNQSKSSNVRLDVNSLLLRGMDLLKDEGKHFSSDKSRTGGQTSFMRTILKGGTLTDRVSALTLLVQSSPIHNLMALEQLFNMARKKNRRMVVLAVDSMKDLLTGGGLSSGSIASGLLPDDRKLRYMVDTVVHVEKPSDSELVLFAFEDRLKRLFYEFLGSLEQLSHDALPHLRSKAMSVIFDLLISKPEQESNLLKLLVNKLGDQDRKLATKASFLLHQLVTNHHPVMKLVIVKAIEEFMYRHHVSDRAYYFAITTLNQFLLSHDEDDVARRLIDTYFGLFNKFANDARDSKSSIDHKLLSGLLTGVNRAFPYAKDVLMREDLVAKQGSEKLHVTTDKLKASKMLVNNINDATPSALAKHMETLYKIAHHDHFTVQVQALSLIFQIIQSKPDSLCRYYRVLYSAVLRARGLASAKQLSLFLNLLYRSVKADCNIERVQAFMKRILLLAAHDRHPGFSIGCLWMVATLMQSHESPSVLWNMIKMSEDEPGVASKVYDPLARSPEFAHASSTCLWELVALANHYHPSVQVFARALLSGKPLAMPAGVDPLDTFTLSKFLEKFTYKKPKNESPASKFSSRSSSMPVAGSGLTKRSTFMPEEDVVATTNSKKLAQMKVGDGLPLNSASFLQRTAAKVAADEIFFHQFFSRQEQIRLKKRPGSGPSAPADKKSGAKAAEDGADSDGDDLDEDEIERAIFDSADASTLQDDVSDSDDDEYGNELAAVELGVPRLEETECAELTTVNENELFDLEAAFANSAEMSGDDSDDFGAPAAAQKLNFDDESDGFDSDDDNARSRRKNKKKNDKLKLGYSLSGSVFASAEEFSRMLESNEGLDVEDELDDFDDVIPASAASGWSGKKGGKKNKRKSTGSNGNDQLRKKSRRCN